MQALDNPRHEAIAHAIAQGMTNRAAARKANYADACGKLGVKIASAPFQARIAEIRASFGWGDTRDLAPVINELAKAALKALAMNSAAAIKAGGELLRIVADLKQRLPPDVDPGPMFDPPMTSEEWAAKFKTGA